MKTVQDFIKNIKKYRNGAEGMISWCNDFVCVPIYKSGSGVASWIPMGELPTEPNPLTGKSYATMWENQQNILREALIMDKGQFKYRLIVLCWPRGEGKSFVGCLIQAWKFFCFPKQSIVLGANSKDQVKFVHYDIIRDMILNSPVLLKLVGKDNIREKEVRIKDAKGNLRSVIRSISSFSGIVSNISGYSFSEIFDMKNPKFFTQLDGSMRSVPNAIGFIDSTVSTKDHILYKLFAGVENNETESVFFSHRYSNNANPKDYWNPYTDEAQLKDYKAKFPFGDFERYFLNLWSSGVNRIFDDVMVDGMRYIGANGNLFNSYEVKGILESLNKYKKSRHELISKKLKDIEGVDKEIYQIENKLIPISSFYTLKDSFNNPVPITPADLNKLSDAINSDFAIVCGMDMGDPYSTRGYAKTVVIFLAKGLPNSRNQYITDENPNYIYFVIHVKQIATHSITEVKREIDMICSEFDDVESVCSERYGAWDMQEWCGERGLKFTPVFPNYDRQKEAMKEIFTLLNTGRLKSPPLSVLGVQTEDVLVEELKNFDHTVKTGRNKGWFGSPNKYDKYGVQDDTIFALAWALYGGKTVNVDDFKRRDSQFQFGYMVQNKNLLAKH